MTRDHLLHPCTAPVVALCLLLVSPTAGAQEEARILIGGPDVGGEPGSLVTYGRVFGTPPFHLTVGGREVAVSEDTTWQYTITEGPGNVHLSFALEDGAGARASAEADFLVLPDFDPADDRPVRTVASAKELVDALGSHVRVVLRPGTYALDALPAGELRQGCVRRTGDGALVLTGYEDLDLIGTAGSATVLTNRTPDGTTLVLDRTRKVRFVALELTHEPVESSAAEGGKDRAKPAGGDEGAGPVGPVAPTKPRKRAREGQAPAERGGVVRVNNGYQTWFRYCTLRGAGTGLVAQHSNVVILDHGSIEGCSVGILRLINTKHSTFIDSRFLDNGSGRPGDFGVSIEGRERRDIDFRRMEVRGNRPGPGRGLFHLEAGAVPVYFQDGVIRDNVAARLRSGPAAKQFLPVNSEVQRF